MGSSSNFSTIIKPKLGDIEIPIPYPDHPEHPSAEQRRIGVYLEAVRERMQALKGSQREIEVHMKELESAMLGKAFRGEL